MADHREVSLHYAQFELIGDATELIDHHILEIVR
jgi:hypothetical protein